MGIPGVKDSMGLEIHDGDEVRYSHKAPPPGEGKGGTVICVYYNGTVSVKDAKSGKTVVVTGSLLMKVV